jgi:uncharacterized RDD family membrane protein YckC
MSTAAGPDQVQTPAVAASAPETHYVGLVTRGVAFAIDAALINVVAIIVGVGASLILSLLHLPSPLKAVLAAVGAAVYIGWSVGYFVVFWSTTGQTPGDRLMQLRVLGADDREAVGPRRALVRCVGILLAAIPLFAGFVPILFDARRRGFHDRLAGTVVVEAPALSVAATRRAAKLAAYHASKPPPEHRSYVSGDDRDEGDLDAVGRRDGRV